jgi:hypothetical protein
MKWCQTCGDFVDAVQNRDGDFECENCQSWVFEVEPGGPACYLQVITSHTTCQEHYETASRDAGRRARQLRKLGYRVVSSPLGQQVTGLGLVKMTMLSIVGDVTELPPVRIERL